MTCVCMLVEQEVGSSILNHSRYCTNVRTSCDNDIFTEQDAVGIESDSNSAATDDAGLAAEKNKIALENLKSLTRQEENDEDLDEDVKDLLEKDNSDYFNNICRRLTCSVRPAVSDKNSFF